MKTPSRGSKVIQMPFDARLSRTQIQKALKSYFVEKIYNSNSVITVNTFEEENEKTHINESQSPNEVVEKEQNSAAPIVAVVVVSIIVVAGTVAGVRAYKKK